MGAIEDALESIKKGNIIVVYDGEGREGEADLIFSAGFATPQKVETLRKDGGGLICAAINANSAKEIGLPFYTDLLETSTPELKTLCCRKTAYGDKPSFSVSVNHSGVFTGITDNDRALTLKRLDEVLKGNTNSFSNEFCSPGHIPLLIGSGIENRKGHTELALELGKRAGLENGVMVLCEMLGKGSALPKEDAKNYAEKNQLVFLEGKGITGESL